MKRVALAVVVSLVAVCAIAGPNHLIRNADEQDPVFNGSAAASVTDAGSGTVISSAERGLVTNAIQPSDNVSELTNDAGYLTAESDPDYNANAFATNMDQDVSIESSPTFDVLSLSSASSVSFKLHGGNGTIDDSSDNPLIDLSSRQLKFGTWYLGSSNTDSQLVTKAYVDANAGTGDFKADGTVPMTGILQMGGNAVTNSGRYYFGTSGKYIDVSGTNFVFGFDHTTNVTFITAPADGS